MFASNPLVLNVNPYGIPLVRITAPQNDSSTCLDSIFDIQTLEIKVIIVGSLVQVPKSYESCCPISHGHLRTVYSHAVEITPEMFITALTKLTNVLS